MASCFAIGLERLNLTVNEAGAPTNTKKRQNLAWLCSLVGRKNVLTEFAAKSQKMILKTLSTET